MRLLFAMAAALMVAQCATPEDKRFRVGDAANGFVVIGVAEAQSNTSPIYTWLWRRLDANGAFLDYDGDPIFEPRTHGGG